MSKSGKHTPGPWEMMSSGVLISGSRGICKSIGIFRGIASDQNHVDEHYYNNKLIEAAPELLESLEEILDEEGMLDKDDEYFKDKIAQHEDMHKQWYKAWKLIKKIKGD